MESRTLDARLAVTAMINNLGVSTTLQLLQLFLADLSATEQRLAQVDELDAATLKFLANNLKGTAANYGATGLAEAAQRLCLASNEANITTLQPALSAMQQQCIDARKEYSSILEAISPS